MSGFCELLIVGPLSHQINTKLRRSFQIFGNVFVQFLHVGRLLWFIIMIEKYIHSEFEYI